MRRPKCSASSGTSPWRARSGGKVMTSNDSRSSRSARNLPFVDLRRQVLVRRGDDADVDRDRLGRADARDLAIFDGAQQPVLRGHRQGAELVEEQSAAVRLLEAAVACLGRAGEASGLVTEQLRLDQILRQRGAVHDNQRAGPSGRQVVQTLGDQLLAGAALADHEHRSVERRGAARALDRVEEREALADELVRAFQLSLQNSDRLLVANPTIWQGFSAVFDA